MFNIERENAQAVFLLCGTLELEHGGEPAALGLAQRALPLVGRELQHLRDEWQQRDVVPYHSHSDSDSERGGAEARGARREARPHNTTRTQRREA